MKTGINKPEIQDNKSHQRADHEPAPLLGTQLHQLIEIPHHGASSARANSAVKFHDTLPPPGFSFTMGSSTLSNMNWSWPGSLNLRNASLKSVTRVPSGADPFKRSIFPFLKSICCKVRFSGSSSAMAFQQSSAANFNACRSCKICNLAFIWRALV